MICSIFFNTPGLETWQRSVLVVLVRSVNDHGDILRDDKG